MRNDPVLNAVRDLRPQDAEGWAQSPSGQHTLQVVLSQGKTQVSRRRPLRTLVTGGALLAVLAGGGAMAAAGGLPWDEPKYEGHAMCAETLSRNADLSQVSTKKNFDPRNPGASCARLWKQMYPSEPVPRSFTACFHPGADVEDPFGGYHSDPNAPGGPVIYPADGLSPAQACARIGAKPIPVRP